VLPNTNGILFQTQNENQVDSIYAQELKNDKLVVSWNVSAFAKNKISLKQKIKGLCGKSNDEDKEEKQEFEQELQLYVPSRTAPDGSTIILNKGILKFCHNK
jgi:hypothetical protein